jgi:hypothetical protein
MNVTYHWDPYLNSSLPQYLLQTHELPSVVIVKAGYWDMKVNPAEGYTHFEQSLTNVQNLINKFQQTANGGKSKIYISLLHPIDETMLKPTRENITQQWVNTYNRKIVELFIDKKMHNVIVPKHWYQLYQDNSQLNLDGLHYDDKIPKMEMNLMLNDACNDAISINKPHHKSTCGVEYNTLSTKQICLMVFFAIIGLLSFIASKFTGM